MANHLFTGRSMSPNSMQAHGPYPRAPGRPDMGYYVRDPRTVPYPQEPDRKRRDFEYMQPPEIGYDPYKEPEPMKPQLGWLLLLRYNCNGDDDVRTALTMTAKHLRDKGGRLLGVAKHHNLRIREGGRNWLTFGKMRHSGSGWNVQTEPVNDEVPYSIIVIRFASLTNAVHWLNSDNYFKQKDFPGYYGMDIMAFPEHEPLDDSGSYDTIILSDFDKISHEEYFRDKFSLPLRDLIRNKYGGRPFLVTALVGAYNERSRLRQAVMLRGSWMSMDSITAISFMPNFDAADQLFRDPEFLELQQNEKKVADPTTVIFKFEPPDNLRETPRYQPSGGPRYW